MAAPSREPFSEAEDLIMFEMRAADQGWREIGERLGRDHTSCMRRWDRTDGKRRLEQLRWAALPAPVPQVDTWLSSPNRGPLPAGHPVTWGAIALSCHVDQ